MPHKRNPITCEQISGLSRVIRSNAQTGFENVALWHERDNIAFLSRARDHSRFHYSRRLPVAQNHQLDGNHVRVSRSHESQPRKHGRPGFQRPTSTRPGRARGVSRRRLPHGADPCHACLEGRPEFRELVMKDKDITSRVPKAQIDRAFDLKRQLRNIDKIFARVFKKNQQKIRRERAANRVPLGQRELFPPGQLLHRLTLLPHRSMPARYLLPAVSIRIQSPRVRKILLGS